MALQRHFLNWDQPALPAVVDYLIQRYAHGHELDLSEVLLVFPGRRAARRTTELLVQRAGTRWPALIPPRMLTFDHFPEELYEAKQSLADDLTQLLVWKQAVTSIRPKEIVAAFPSIPDEESLTAWMSLCELLRRQHDELAAEGMEFDEIFRVLSSRKRKDEAARWKALRRIQSEYLVRMDDLRLWDRQAARLIAVEQKECRTTKDIILVSTVDMNRIVRQMLDQVSDRVTALIHAPQEEAESFDEYGCLIPDRWTTRLLNLPEEIMRITNDAAEQAGCVVREIAMLDAHYRADDITIGVTSDNTVPSILQALSSGSLSGRWAVDMYVRNSRPYRLLESLAAHLASAQDTSPPDYATMRHCVRHPDVFEWINGEVSRKGRSNLHRNWLGVMDDYLEKHLQQFPAPLPGNAAVREVIDAVLSGISRLLQCLLPAYLFSASESNSPRNVRKRASTTRQRQMTLDEQLNENSQHPSAQLQKKQPLTVWADGCLRLLAAVYGDRELSEDSRCDRGIVAGFQALQSAADSLARMPSTVMPSLTAAQAIQFLLRQVADTMISAEPDQTGIDIQGWLDLQLDDAPILLLTGFNEGFIPESGTADVFLPDSFRNMLGLKDNDRRYARDAYAITAILASRKKVRLIAARIDVNGNPLHPSRLWFAADAESIPRRVQMYYRHEESEKEDSRADTSSVVSSFPDSAESSELPSVAGIHRVSGFTVPEPVYDNRRPTEFSVSAFRDFIACPYRYFLSRELHLRPVSGEFQELSATAFGSLVHEVLKEFAVSPLKDSVVSGPIGVFLLNTLRRIVLHEYGRDHSATISVQLKMLEDRLLKFADWQAATAADGWRICHTEIELTYDHFEDIHGRPVRIKGRIDRIDRHAVTGEWRVLDYKTGEAGETPEKSHRTSDQWTNLQLPLYRLLVRSLDITDEVGLGYVHLPGDLSRIGCEMAEWTEEELASAEREAQRIAAEMIDLRIDRVARGSISAPDDFSRIRQDSVIERNIPWLTNWVGRRSEQTTE